MRVESVENMTNNCHKWC